MQIVSDTWRAFLVVLVVVSLREKQPAPAAPFVQSQWQPAYNAPVVVNAEPKPIRRVGTALAELAESVVSLIK